MALVATGDAAGALEAAQQAYALAAARETAGSFNRADNADEVVYAALISRRVEAAPPMLTEVASHSNNNSWVGAAVQEAADSKRVWLMNFTGDTVGAARFAPVAIESATRAKWPWTHFRPPGWSYALARTASVEADGCCSSWLIKEQPPGRSSTQREGRAAVKLALGDAGRLCVVN